MHQITEQLLQVINDSPLSARYCVAFSGGLDSTVLLHALHEAREALPGTLVAVHVDHGLHADSAKWARHCRSVAGTLGLSLTVLKVDAGPAKGHSPEAAARAARYHAFSEWLREEDCLLTAHHQDDQAETLLLQLFRGSGVKGLAGMPVAARLGGALHLRPLLEFSRRSLRGFAADRGLEWIEDPSNEATRFDRNFLRLEVIPLLQQRWAGINGTLARAAGLQAEAAQLLEETGARDLSRVAGRTPGTIDIGKLRRLDSPRRRNVLRYWLHSRSLSMPSEAMLKGLEHDFLAAGRDAMPFATWRNAEVRRYRNELYAFRPMPAHDPLQELHWLPDKPLRLETAGGVLEAAPAVGRGLQQRFLDRPLAVRFRQGGEICRVAGRGCSHRLKHLFQERGVPPWERDRTPLIYVSGELAAVGDLWICEPFQAGPGEAGFRIEWHRGMAGS